MTCYVAGFLIDPNERTVALVRKNKPRWQAGRLNGVGGKIELGESSLQTMRREFFEETGAYISDWEWFATVQGEWGIVYFHRAFGTTDHVRTVEDEVIEVHSLDDMPWDECLPNLSWLVPLALYTHDVYLPVTAEEVA